MVFLLVLKLKTQHLIQQVFNVSQNGSFFTDLLDFVEKNLYYQTTRLLSFVVFINLKTYFSVKKVLCTRIERGPNGH